jgi:hypothetical protein
MFHDGALLAKALAKPRSGRALWKAKKNSAKKVLEKKVYEKKVLEKKTQPQKSPWAG